MNYGQLSFTSRIAKVHLNLRINKDSGRPHRGEWAREEHYSNFPNVKCQAEWRALVGILSVDLMILSAKGEKEGLTCLLEENFEESDYGRESSKREGRGTDILESKGEVWISS